MMFLRAFLAATLLHLSSASWVEPAQALQSVNCEQCLQTSSTNPLEIGIQGRPDVVYGVRIDRTNCGRHYICHIKLIVESTNEYEPATGYYQALNLQWPDAGNADGVQVYCNSTEREVLLRCVKSRNTADRCYGSGTTHVFDATQPRGCSQLLLAFVSTGDPTKNNPLVFRWRTTALCSTNVQETYRITRTDYTVATSNAPYSYCNNDRTYTTVLDASDISPYIEYSDLEQEHADIIFYDMNRANTAILTCINGNKCPTSGYLRASKVRMEIKLPKASTIFPNAKTTEPDQYYALQGVQITVRGVNTFLGAPTTTLSSETLKKNNFAVTALPHVAVIFAALLLL